MIDLAKANTAIEQKAADLADDSGAMIDHALACTMECLNVLLLDGLLRNERNVRLPRGGANRFGVIAVVLLASDEWLHILRADDLHLMAERLELSRPAEGAGAGFNHNGAAINLCDDDKQLIAHDPAFENDTAIAVHAMELEDVFGDVDTEDVDGHGCSPFATGSQPERKEGEPSIPLAGDATMAG